MATTESQIERGDTRWVHRPDDTRTGRHLSVYGYTAVSLYREVMYRPNPTATLATKQAMLEKLGDDPQSRVARPYLEKALRMAKNTLATPKRDRSLEYAREGKVIEAMGKMDDENWPKPVVIHPASDNCCRHGVPFSDDCPKCEE